MLASVIIASRYALSLDPSRALRPEDALEHARVGRADVLHAEHGGLAQTEKLAAGQLARQLEKRPPPSSWMRLAGRSSRASKSSTAKVATAVVAAMDHHAMAIRSFEENVASAKEQVFTNAKRANLELSRPLWLHLAVRENGEALAITEDWGFGFPLGKLPMSVR